MSWPNKIYVATNAGIYYTDNFVDPGTQPIWTTINTGLANTDIKSFQLDPFHNADRQYALTTTGDILYKRELGGSWVSILTPAQVNTLVGGSGAEIFSFTTDPSIDGRLWAMAGSGTNGGYYSLYSSDYGATWGSHKSYNAGTCCQCGDIRAYGNNIWYWRSSGPGCDSKIHYSSNGGNPWNTGGDYVSYFDSNAILEINPLLPNQVYTADGPDFIKLTNTGISTQLQEDIAPGYEQHGGIWFHPTDANYQRIAHDDKLAHTHDAWANYTEVTVSPEPGWFSIYNGSDFDQMIIGCISGDIRIGVLYGDTDTTVSNISGTNYATPPYTDSIPKTVTLAWNGVQAVSGSIGHVYTNAVAMPGYAGEDRGIPIEGDRSARDALKYPLRHTNDIDIGIHWTLDKLQTIIGTGTNELEMTKYSSNPVITKGSPGSWEDVDVANPDVFWDVPNNRWVMNYSGYDGSVWKTGIAYSNDLYSWTKEPTNPVFEPDGTEGYIAANGVIVYKNGIYYLFYQVAKSGVAKICAASSTDLLNWTRLNSGNPVIDVGAGGQWDESGTHDPSARLMTDGITIEVFYAGHNAGGDYAIGRATSTDGITFSKTGKLLDSSGIAIDWGEPYPLGDYGTNYEIWADQAIVSGYRTIARYTTIDGGTTWADQGIILGPSGSGWDSTQVFDNCTFPYNGILYLFYSGATTAGEGENLGIQIGLATALYPYGSGQVIDEKVKISANDITPGYLIDKLVAGANITFTENDDGGNESITIATTSIGELLFDEDGNILLDEDNDGLYED
jgi:hypothetical protein